MDGSQPKRKVKELGVEPSRSAESGDFRKASRSYRTELEGATKPRRKRKRSRTVDTERGFQRKSSALPISWIVWVSSAAILIGLFVATILYYKSRNQEIEGEMASTSRVTQVEAALPSDASAKWNGILPKTIAENFLKAKTDEERLLWVRDSQKVAEILHRFYQQDARKQEVFSKLTEMPQNLAGQEASARFSVQFTDGSKRLISIQYDESGAGKVDFKCYSRYCDESWASLLNGSVTKAHEMRCILLASDYYNHEFADESTWLSVLATSPDFEDVIYLYVKRDDPEFVAFLQNPPKAQTRYTIALESVGMSYKNRQFRVTKVHRGAWVIP